MALPVVLSLAAADFGVGLPAMAVAVTLFSLGMGLASVPAGLLADRIGTARVTTLFFWALAAGAGLCSVAPGYRTFLAAHALLGVAAGLYHPAGLGMISLATDGGGMGKAFGMHGVAGSAGIAVVPLLMLRWSGESGWRGGYAALAGAAVLAALWGHALRRTGRVDDGVPPPEPAAAKRSVEVRTGLILLMLVVSANAFLLDGFLTFFPEAVRRRDLPTFEPDVIMMGILALGGVGQWLGGLWARGRSEAARYAFLIGLQAAVFGTTALLVDRGALPLLMLAAFAFANYMTQPIENHLLAAFTSQARRSAAYALKFLVALVVASPAPWLVVTLAERRGETAMYTVLACVGALGLLAGARFVRSERRLRTG